MPAVLVRRRWLVVVTKIVAWLTSTGVAVAALVLSVRALNAQLQMNDVQQEINRQQQEQFERRFASRVATWRGAGGGRAVFYFQNRSFLPLADPELVLAAPAGTTTRFTLPNIPPCVVVSFDLPRFLAGQTTSSSSKDFLRRYEQARKAWADSRLVGLYFVVEDERWGIDARNLLSRLEAVRYGADPKQVERFSSLQNASDCSGG